MPTYNESGNIAVAVLSQLLDPLFPEDYELIVVDDDSPDYTWKIGSCSRAVERTSEPSLVCHRQVTHPQI